MIKIIPRKGLQAINKTSFKKTSLFSLVSLLLLAIFPAVVSAQPQSQTFCFASAASYYEQVYCELQARGDAKNLPPFYQFKRNDAMTQALLLKRPALRAGIELPMPKATALSAPAAKKSLSEVRQQPSASLAANADRPRCRLTDNSIVCGEQRFDLTGNRKNSRLSEGVLNVENKMSLPVYTGLLSDQTAVNNYLANAYRQYLEKMHSIGLGGVTMTYAKFDFLFFDLHEKGLDFSQRFDTMYDFLKKDKAKMAVSEKQVIDSQLRFEDCDFLPESMFACSRSGRNYLFLSVSE